MNIEWYLWYLLGCGFLAQFWIYSRLGRVFGRAMYAAVVASSLLRFAWACARVHGFRERRLPAWMYAPGYWLSFFLMELEGKPRKVEHFGGYGQWNGIGKWVVYPRQ
ncbi:hypothetical protein [uncultured Pseudomonas sp.]|uniref:hypothetical protein n=1 Tax=uncultured Pseudomonas sp. TaxID=114707 RepID=UPI0025F97D53|nr:hypothetical protein [uncultured Pseudomonas sp.]